MTKPMGAPVPIDTGACTAAAPDLQAPREKHQGIPYKVRLDVLVAKTHPQQSRMRWQSHIRDGFIQVDGSVVTDPGLRIAEDAHITVDESVHPVSRMAVTNLKAGGTAPHLLDDMTVTPVAMDLDIIYEDPHLLVLNKPWGLVVHPGAGTHEPTLVHGLLAHSDQWSLCGGQHKPGIVHRLDKDTSGLMVVAKTDGSHRHLGEQFAQRLVEKKYWAFVWGRPTPPFGRMEQPLGRDPRNRLRQGVDVLHGRPALTRYRTLASQNGMSLLDCELLTGRTHQIRVHCAHLGHPLLGDSLYGHGHGHGRQALHAHTLAFDHPHSGKRLKFQTPLPQDLVELYQRVGAPPL